MMQLSDTRAAHRLAALPIEGIVNLLVGPWLGCAEYRIPSGSGAGFPRMTAALGRQLCSCYFVPTLESACSFRPIGDGGHAVAAEPEMPRNRLKRG